MVNCSSFGNWLLLSVFQQKTQQFSNLFHTFEEMPPFKNLKSCKVDLSVLVILSWSPPVLWIKEISQFPITERFHSLLNPAVKRGKLLENDGTELIWSLSDLSFGSQAENMKTFTRSCCVLSETSKWRKINRQNKQPVHKHTIWIISLTEGLSVRRDKKAKRSPLKYSHKAEELRDKSLILTDSQTHWDVQESNQLYSEQPTLLDDITVHHTVHEWLFVASTA